MTNKPVRVLLVEDDADDYYLTKELLAEKSGTKFKLDWAKDFDSGLAAITNCEHDAYLLDYRLGTRDGLELLREGLTRGCKGPLILLTGAGDGELALQALDAGASDYLVKGEIDAANLERSIRYSMQQARYADELEEKVRQRTAEMRESEEKYRSLFGSIDSGYCIIEMIFDDREKPVDYRFLEVNPAFEKQTGLKDATGKRVREVIPQIETQWIKSFGSIALTGIPARFENRAEQLERWFDVYAYRFGRPEDRQVAVLFNDITGRRYEESRLALLARLGEITRTTENPGELLYAVSQAVGESLNVRRTLFKEIDLENDLETVHRDYCRGVRSVAGTHKVSEYSPVTFAEMAGGKTVVNIDSKTDARTARWYKKVYEPSEERSYVAVPLMRGGAWVASFWVSDNRARDWSDVEVRMIESIGERAWLAVEKLRSEVALRASEERFASAFNSSPLIVTITSLETGKLVEVNETFVKVTGYSHAQAVGSSTIELGLWEKNDERDAELQSVMHNGQIRNREYNFRTKDGTTLVGLLSAELLKLSGEPCALTVIQDITERKRAEDALSESEERFRALFASAPMAVFVCDRNAVIQQYNRYAVELWGREPTCGVEKHCGSMRLWLPDGKILPHTRSPVMDVLRTGISALNVEVFIERPDASRLPVLVNFAALKNERGEITGAITSFTDITDRKLIEEELRRHRGEMESLVVERTIQLNEVNKNFRAESTQRLAVEREAVRLLKQVVTIQEDERRRIARDLHDDLGQKLTALRLKLENAKKMCDDQPVCDEIESTQALAQTIDADVGFLAWEMRPPVLDDMGLATALATFVKEWSRFSGVEAEFRVSGLGTRLTPEAEINLYRITQEALNNAHKYAKARSVSVMLEKRKYDVTLIIDDDGVGFDERAKPKSKKGLGLTGMRERAALIGGELEIETSPGSGTTIFVKVPTGSEQPS